MSFHTVFHNEAFCTIIHCKTYFSVFASTINIFQTSPMQLKFFYQPFLFVLSSLSLFFFFFFSQINLDDSFEVNGIYTNNLDAAGCIIIRSTTNIKGNIFPFEASLLWHRAVSYLSAKCRKHVHGSGPCTYDRPNIFKIYHLGKQLEKFQTFHSSYNICAL